MTKVTDRGCNLDILDTMEEPKQKRVRVDDENPFLCSDGFTRILEKSPNEEERIRELEQMKIYGTFPVPQLDVITSLAKRLMKTSIVKINLVGESDQWIVSCSSKIDENVTPRDGFCAWAVWKKANFCIEDAKNHPIMKDHLFVRTGKVGAYFGVPLITPSGNAIGAICAVHGTAWTFSASDIKTLEDLAKMAVNAIFLRHSNLSDKQISDYQRIRTKDLREDKRVLLDGLRKFPDGVFVWSLRSKSIAFANEGFERITGWNLKEIEGVENSPLHYLVGRESKDLMEFSGWFGENSNQIKREFEAVRKDGKKYWAFIQISPTKDCHGEISSFLGIISDVTERKSAEIELETNRDNIHLAVKAKSGFLANMSHEIKTPLHAICATANSLVSLGDQTKDQLELAKMVKVSADSLLGLISDILDYSKIEAEQLELIPSTFSIRDILNSVLASFQSASQRKGIDMKIEVEKDVCEIVYMDSKRLQQILSKLVSNAIIFTESGQISITVSKRNLHSDGNKYIQFVVKDTGIGVKEDAAKCLFQPFWQMDQSRTRRYGGTGLGLAISRGLAIAMGGEMWARSVFGQGSTFGFYVLDSEGSPLPFPSPCIRNASPISFSCPYQIVQDMREVNGIIRPLPIKIGIKSPFCPPNQSMDCERGKKRGLASFSSSSASC